MKTQLSLKRIHISKTHTHFLEASIEKATVWEPPTHYKKTYTFSGGKHSMKTQLPLKYIHISKKHTHFFPSENA